MDSMVDIYIYIYENPTKEQWISFICQLVLQMIKFLNHVSFIILIAYQFLEISINSRNCPLCLLLSSLQCWSRCFSFRMKPINHHFTRFITQDSVNLTTEERLEETSLPEMAALDSCWGQKQKEINSEHVKESKAGCPEEGTVLFCNEEMRTVEREIR